MRIAISPTRAPIRIRRSGLTAWLALGMCMIAHAQPSAARFPDPPVWPGEDHIGAALEHQYVFVTSSRDQLVIRVPPDSEYAKSGKPAIIRYDLHNRLQPSFVVQMAAASLGNYSYDYTVRNGGSAQDDIQSWWLVIPPIPSLKMPPDSGNPAKSLLEKDPVVEARAGRDGWQGAAAGYAIIRQVELPEEPLGRVLMWVQDDDRKTIKPGTSQMGFHVESSCRPGFSTSLSYPGIWVSIDQDLPEQVFAQLDFYDAVWGKIPVLTFGPMFCGSADHDAIVRNAQSGIRRLIETKRLDEGAAFVQEVLHELNGPMGPDAMLSHAASSEIEQELYTALSLSLGLKVNSQSGR